MSELEKAITRYELEKRTVFTNVVEQADEMTYQAPFPASVECLNCKTGMRLMVLIDDAAGMISRERPEAVKIWPHDVVAVAVYLCTGCGEAKADWNQA